MRRLFRYRLRTLLIFVAVCCALLGWYEWNARQRRAEKHALQSIAELAQGWTFEVLYEDDTLFCGWGVGGTAMIRCPAYRLMANRLESGSVERHIRFQNIMDAFYRVEEVSLFTEDFDDRMIPLMPVFSHLKKLDLVGTSVSDQGLDELHRLLPNTSISVNGSNLARGTINETARAGQAVPDDLLPVDPQ